jgi:hypothetical protein
VREFKAHLLGLKAVYHNESKGSESQHNTMIIIKEIIT